LNEIGTMGGVGHASGAREREWASLAAGVGLR
jgi:hypothetical protein